MAKNEKGKQTTVHTTQNRKPKNKQHDQKQRNNKIRHFFDKYLMKIL